MRMIPNDLENTPNGENKQKHDVRAELGADSRFSSGLARGRGSRAPLLEPRYTREGRAGTD